MIHTLQSLGGTSTIAKKLSRRDQACLLVDAVQPSVHLEGANDSKKL
jgi:hypothetical protein